MGRNRLAGFVNETPLLVEGVEGTTAESNASQDTAPQFSRGCSSRRECLTCASQMSKGENTGTLALLGLARSVTGNARLRGMWDVSIAESGTGANVNLIHGRRTGGGHMPQAKRRSCWR
jgi:hypothetical protein